MSRAKKTTGYLVNESLKGWIKEEQFIDLKINHSYNVPELIGMCVEDYNKERPSYALNYEIPVQFKTEMENQSDFYWCNLLLDYFR